MFAQVNPNKDYTQSPKTEIDHMYSYLELNDALIFFMMNASAKVTLYWGRKFLFLYLFINELVYLFIHSFVSVFTIYIS